MNGARGVQMGTVVFGLLLGLFAGCVLLADGADVDIDAAAVAIAGLIAAGALLITAAVANISRERRDRGQEPH